MKKYKECLFIALVVLGVVAVGCNKSESESKLKLNKKEIVVEHLTLDSFKEKICDCGIGTNESADWKYKGDVPAVIDFYADWCGPCKMVAPVLQELSEEYSGLINFYKVDTEKEQQLAGMFGIRSIPSILFIPKSDEKPQMSAGALPKSEFKKIFSNVFGVEEPATK